MGHRRRPPIQHSRCGNFLRVLDQEKILGGLIGTGVRSICVDDFPTNVGTERTYSLAMMWFQGYPKLHGKCGGDTD